MIVTETILIEKSKNNIDIEKSLLSRGIKPLRWAIVRVDEKHYHVSVSYERPTQSHGNY